MAELRELVGRILTPEGWIDGRLRFDGRVREIVPEKLSGEPARILPGFVDLHVHGGAGADVMGGAEEVRTMTRLHARHGTTSLLATTVTAPVEDTRRAARGVAEVCAARRDGEARVLGAHLEGPFVSPDVLGAQPPFPLAPDLAFADELCGIAPVRVVTMAPEIDPDGALLRRFVERNARVQLGHTACGYAQAVAAFQAGASGVTHLYNAMSGLHHRKPGLVGAALAHADYAELILDLIHVDEGAARVALRAIPKLYCVTDASAAAGMPDGDGYRLGTHGVCKQDGAVRLADGTLAGSALTMDQALRNLVGLGMDLAQASLRVSTYACDHLGVADRGRIAPGAWADLVALDADLQVKAVFVEGEPAR